MARRLQESGATAIKVKVGGRMSRNADAFPGRTEGLVSLARRTLGDDVAIYVDGNGSYDAARAIEVGRMMEAHGVGFFEEPCPFDEYEQTKAVADALDMPVAGGEQDSSEARFRWMIEQRGVDVVQPDVVYNGGLIRILRVARMAEAAGMPITPHCPKADPNSAYMLHFASVTPNLGPYQEYHVQGPKPVSWYSPLFDAQEGVLPLPDRAGVGRGVRPRDLGCGRAAVAYLCSPGLAHVIPAWFRRESSFSCASGCPIETFGHDTLGIVQNANRT